jgi:hypothetical protein
MTSTLGYPRRRKDLGSLLSRWRVQRSSITNNAPVQPPLTAVQLPPMPLTDKERIPAQSRADTTASLSPRVTAGLAAAVLGRDYAVSGTVRRGAAWLGFVAL